MKIEKILLFYGKMYRRTTALFVYLSDNSIKMSFSANNSLRLGDYLAGLMFFQTVKMNELLQNVENERSAKLKNKLFL